MLILEKLPFDGKSLKSIFLSRWIVSILVQICQLISIHDFHIKWHDKLVILLGQHISFFLLTAILI
jgi:hypothetical protein